MLWADQQRFLKEHDAILEPILCSYYQRDGGRRKHWEQIVLHAGMLHELQPGLEATFTGSSEKSTAPSSVETDVFMPISSTELKYTLEGVADLWLVLIFFLPLLLNQIEQHDEKQNRALIKVTAVLIQKKELLFGCENQMFPDRSICISHQALCFQHGDCKHHYGSITRHVGW